MFPLGRRFWHIVDVKGRYPFSVGPLLVIGKPRFFPAGKIKIGDAWVERTRSLIQIYTDPGGIRTMAAASIRFSNPKAEVARLQRSREKG